MPELKKIRIRKAKSRDIGLFRKLWISLLKKNVEEGSIIIPTSEAMAMYETMFDRIVDGDLDGIVLFIADKGVLMWGPNESLFEYSPGNLVFAWGHYVVPDSLEGIEEALLKEAEIWAREKGYSGIMTHFHKDVVKEFIPWAILAYKSFD